MQQVSDIVSTVTESVPAGVCIGLNAAEVALVFNSHLPDDGCLVTSHHDNTTWPPVREQNERSENLQNWLCSSYGNQALASLTESKWWVIKLSGTVEVPGQTNFGPHTGRPG